MKHPPGKINHFPGKAKRPPGKAKRAGRKAKCPDRKMKRPSGKTKRPDRKMKRPGGKTKRPDRKTSHFALRTARFPWFSFYKVRKNMRTGKKNSAEIRNIFTFARFAPRYPALPNRKITFTLIID